VNDSTVVSGDAAVCTSSSEAGQKLDADTPIETTEQLRIAIDQGRGGHKIDVNGPAAAPLGTDAEAGGLQLIRVMCGRRPRCKENLMFGLRSGASHVSGLFARHHDRWP